MRSGDINIFADSNANVIADFVDDTDFTMSEQDQFGETNYLLIDTSKPGALLRPAGALCTVQGRSTARSSST